MRQWIDRPLPITAARPHLNFTDFRYFLEPHSRLFLTSFRRREQSVDMDFTTSLKYVYSLFLPSIGEKQEYP